MDPLLIVGLVWLACAVVCGFLAPMKGRPSGEWFFVGLIFGVFGVAALALTEARSPAEMRTCVNCGKTVDPSRKALCQNCGLPFRA